jgi:hypothetical protein
VCDFFNTTMVPIACCMLFSRTLDIACSRITTCCCCRQALLTEPAYATLPADWGGLMHLRTFALHGFVGGLPADWGTARCFPNLENLDLTYNSLNGSLPAEWGSDHSFPEVKQLNLYNISLSGSLPPQWGSNGAFPLLQKLDLSDRQPPSAVGQQRCLSAVGYNELI